MRIRCPVCNSHNDLVIINQNGKVIELEKQEPFNCFCNNCGIKISVIVNIREIRFKENP